MPRGILSGSGHAGRDLVTDCGHERGYRARRGESRSIARAAVSRAFRPSSAPESRRACSRCLACIGLIASFHTIIFAYGRQIYSLSRAGYFPTWLSVTHARHKTPLRALIAGAALGYAVALAIHLAPQGSPVGAVLLNMAVFGAVMAYVLQMASFLALRWRSRR